MIVKSKEKNSLINSSKKGNINVSVNRYLENEKIQNLAKRNGINEEELNDLIRKIEKEQRDLGVPEDKLEDKVIRRTCVMLMKPFVKPISSAEVKAHEKYQRGSKDSNPKIRRYEETEKPDYYSEDIFEWKGMAYLKTNIKPAKFFVNDYRNHRCFETTIKYDKEKDYSSESKKELYGAISFVKVREYEPILPGVPRKFQFSCETDYKKREYKGTLDEITGKIDSDGLIYNEHKIKEILKKVKDLSQKKGAYEISKLPPYPGFFWIDGKLESTQKYEAFDKSKLRSSLEFLDDFVGYYEGNESKIGYSLSWMIMAPFTFAMKQTKNSDLPGSLYLTGKANSGKSTVASLNIYIWRLPRSTSFLSTGQIDSEARIGNAISKMTYPTVFDEGDIIFTENKKAVAALFKSSIYELNARTVLDSSRTETNIPALSSIIFTSNNPAPKDASLGRRMHIFEFSVDHPRTKEEKDKFNESFDPEKTNGPLKTLSAIGDYVAHEMLRNPKNIHRPWTDVARDIWIKMYQDVELEIPNWLENPEKPAGLEESWAEEEEKLFMIFKKLVLQNDKSGSYEGHTEKNLKTQREKAEEVVYGSKAPWITYYAPKKGKDVGKKLVTVDSGILLDMEKEFGVSYELKHIAEDLDGNYGSKSVNGKNRKVAYWELNKFLDKFGPSEEN